MRTKGMMLLLLAALSLSGCRVTGEVENQAYVLVLGVDRQPGGELQLTARVPQIGKSGDDSEGSGGYLAFSAGGGDWPQALEALEQITPRPINLSHIELLVVSEALAQEEGFGKLAANIAETPHLYTTARLVVCEGSARAFIDTQETVIGTRLSSEIDAMLNHYAERGYIPESSLAEAYYALKGFYGDPVAIHGTVPEASQPAVSLTQPQSFDGDEASPMKQRYSGAALFSNGRMVGTLPPAQTALLNLARGGNAALPFECEGSRYTLTPNGTARRTVDIENGRVTLGIHLRFTTLDDVCAEDARRLEFEIERAITDVIQRCQALDSDPFGFADTAAAQFSTISDWLSFDWRSRYGSAAVQADISIRAHDSER